MLRYVVRRSIQALFTVCGVMLITFLLFRVIAGDVSTAYVNQKLGREARQAFYEKHKLDRPAVFNYHRRLELVDKTKGSYIFSAKDRGRSQVAKLLQLHLAPSSPESGAAARGELTLVSRFIFALSHSTDIEEMLGNEAMLVGARAGERRGVANSRERLPNSAGPVVTITLSDGTILSIDLSTAQTCGDLIAAVNNHPQNKGRLAGGISDWSWTQIFDSQFFWHLRESITFTGRSYATDQSLLQIVAERGRFSLALTIPAMALAWLLSMFISCMVAYYRDTWIDRLGVLLSVLGMCVPYLAYMLFGQWVMFKISPEIAVGLSHPMSIYVPVFIAVIAGLGASVRFYRTVILDEINKDYVRTARAKGVPLPGILFKHVLKNCMLPILTNLISVIPFLIMGSLLLERFFGIPGLGDLMLTSITSRDVPIITGLTFLTTVLYVMSLLLTDILYAVFDPRIRLQ